MRLHALASGALAVLVWALAGCAKPPPPPSVTEPPRLAAEESCASTTPAPTLPARPPADPYRLSHAAEMMMTVDGGPRTLTFLCDLPDLILGVGATQTVDGGKRVVGGVVYAHPRADARALPPTIGIEASSAGCKQGELACTFDTRSALGAIDMLREQRIHTSGWVHGFDDMCRALPDDTIAVCSTQTRMAYVELGCDGELHLGIHDAELARAFDLDVESPVLRLRGALDPASPDATAWTFRFRGDARSVAAPTTRPPAAAELAIDLAGKRATLTVDGAAEPCIAWAIDRR